MITTDTSLIGWRAHLQNHTIQGCWSQTKTHLHINLLERRAAHNACTHFFPLIKNRTIRVMTGIGCMFYINRQEGAWSHSLCTEAMKRWNWCIQHNINIAAAYLPGCLNTTVDILSRQFDQNHEWELNKMILQDIFQEWRHPTIELFCNSTEPQMSKLLLESRPWNLIKFSSNGRHLSYMHHPYQCYSE